MKSKLTVKIGDIYTYNNYPVIVLDTSTNNGIGIKYLEGPKKDWEDWVVNADLFSPVEDVMSEDKIK